MIYFDNAATGLPKDKSVAKAMLSAMINCGNPGRSGHKFSENASEIIFLTREALGDMFGAKAENVILCYNATHGLNMAIKGLYKSGTKILMSDLEHNSVIRPSSTIADIKIFNIDIDDDKKTIENFKKCLTDDVSIVVVTHASNVCGRIIPINEISKICRLNNKIFILDGSQSAGYIPINIDESDIDVLCIPGHKGLYGPMGTGAMILNSKRNLCFNTIIEGGSGSFSDDTQMPPSPPERFEAGTIGVPNFSGLYKAVTNYKYEKEKHINCFKYTIDSLLMFKNIKLYGLSYNNLDKYVPVILFNSENHTSFELESILSKKGICARAGFHCSPFAHKKFNTGENGALRISIGKKKSIKECEKFISVLKKIIV
jgi:selenocysteine lyase/cysteine desulfurase